MHKFPKTSKIHIKKIQAFVYRAPIKKPVQTSFGTMLDRPAVIVRIEDNQGSHGWGEIWCNFPNIGAEHRARLVENCIAPIIMEQAWDSPVKAFDTVSKRLEVLAVQTGEPGPIAQAIAGVDIAMWDLAARKMGEPLWKAFGGKKDLYVYASGISPNNPEQLVLDKYAQGYRAFKLKVGFGEQRDLKNLQNIRQALPNKTSLMIDANQAWDVQTAIKMINKLAEQELEWIEEPLRADSPNSNWEQLHDNIRLRIAGGENMRGHKQFENAINGKTFSVIQPDPGKWGGISGCVPIAKKTVANNKWFCPHWLGGGIGLLAAMQIKAIVGNDGYVEVDSNPNPLRELFAPEFLQPQEGLIQLSDSPGLGFEPDLQLAQEFLVNHNY